MRALVVFESMYGNTHVVADHVADGLRSRFDVEVVAVTSVLPAAVRRADLVVCGGPTHAHGLSRAQTRTAAASAAAKDGSTLVLEPGATGQGLRDWLEDVDAGTPALAAAFDTRIDGPAILTGRASKGIAKRLREDGFVLVAEPESFLVDKHNHLLAGEAERARDWGALLAEAAEAAAIGRSG